MQGRRGRGGNCDRCRGASPGRGEMGAAVRQRDSGRRRRLRVVHPSYANPKSGIRRKETPTVSPSIGNGRQSCYGAFPRDGLCPRRRATRRPTPDQDTPFALRRSHGDVANSSCGGARNECDRVELTCTHARFASCPELATGASESDGDAAAIAIGRRQVLDAVAVHITDRHTRRNTDCPARAHAEPAHLCGRRWIAEELKQI